MLMYSVELFLSFKIVQKLLDFIMNIVYFFPWKIVFENI